MNCLIIIPMGIAFLWAGLSLGGSLVAAPAKFQAPSLSLPMALEVGRAQFRWVGVTEAALAVALSVSVFLIVPGAWHWAAVPVTIFAIQWLVLMPPLDARTTQVIAGQAGEGSDLHLFYICFEIAKLLALVLAGLMLARELAHSA